jgi:hypothetical protein
MRVGVWSGYRGGACLTYTSRSEVIGMDFGLAVLAGGTVPTVDFMLPLTVTIPVGSTSTLFDGLYVPIGIEFGYGATTGVKSDGFFRFDVNAGLGYETRLDESLVWRIFDLRAYAMLHIDKTPVDDDRVGHRFDLGAMLMSGLVFK